MEFIPARVSRTPDDSTQQLQTRIRRSRTLRAGYTTGGQRLRTTTRLATVFHFAEDEAEFGCVSERTPSGGVYNNKYPRTIAAAKMPAIAQIDGFGLRPHIATSFRSSFIEEPLNARDCGEHLPLSGHLLRRPPVAIHQLVELLLDCLIVPSSNSMQKEQECQNRTQEHETEVGTSMYRPPNPAPTAAKSTTARSSPIPFLRERTTALSRP
jgi:hypothetical protein